MIHTQGSYPKDKSPKDAELAVLNPSGEFVATFLKHETEKYSDGSTKTRWQFWGAHDTWVFVTNEQEFFEKNTRFLSVN